MVQHILSCSFFLHYFVLLLLPGRDVHSALPSPLSCSTLNATRLKLITFDVFAALMSTQLSVENNIRLIIPSLSSSNVTQLATEWILPPRGYASYADTVFNPLTQLPQPFPYVIRTTLKNALTTLNLLSLYPPDSFIFNALLNYCWSHLQPWPQTSEVLNLLVQNGYALGALSNGDTETLTNITNIFLPNIQFRYIFGSNYPVGSFKPNNRMYNQTLYSDFQFDEILHIAGSLSDATGARLFGMYAGLIRNPPPPDGPNAPCFTFSDITSLPAYLNLSTVSPSPSPRSSPSAVSTSTATVSSYPSLSSTASASASASASATSTSGYTNVSFTPNATGTTSSNNNAENSNREQGPDVPLSSGSIAALCITFFIGGMITTLLVSRCYGNCFLSKFTHSFGIPHTSIITNTGNPFQKHPILDRTTGTPPSTVVSNSSHGIVSHNHYPHHNVPLPNSVNNIELRISPLAK